ncbi:hypothetical protein AAF712_012220 [Marasmius tenuissimus]|uniref:Uncharacterized protein n=1 Tax=Marasmius tenuissimus TaxID=585030 RepID=A0ABR2ZJ56_9AGAR
MATQRHKLKAQDVEIPEVLFVLMIIAKLPKSWANLKEYVIRLKKEDLKLSEIISIITNTWNARTGGHSGPEVYTAAYNTKISGVPKFKSAPNWSGQSGSSGNKSAGKPNGGNRSNQNNQQNQNQNNQNQQGSSKKKNNKKGKGKGKGKKQNKPKQGGQKSHVAALDAQQCSVLEAEFSQPQSVRMSKLASKTVSYRVPVDEHLSIEYPDNQVPRQLLDLQQEAEVEEPQTLTEAFEQYPDLNFQQAMRQSTRSQRIQKREQARHDRIAWNQTFSAGMVSITTQNVDEHIRRNEQVQMEQADDSYSDLDYLEGSDLERFEAAGHAAEAAGSDDEDEVNPLTLPNPRQEEYHPDVSELSSPDDGVPSSGELPHLVRRSQAQVYESQIQELPIQQMASDSEAEAASEDSFED